MFNDLTGHTKLKTGLGGDSVHRYIDSEAGVAVYIISHGNGVAMSTVPLEQTLLQ